MVVDPALTESGGLLDSLSALGGKRIADMNVTELETVWNTVRAIETTLTSYDRTLANQKYARTSEWAESLMMGSMSRKRRNRKFRWTWQIRIRSSPPTATAACRYTERCGTRRTEST